MPKLKTHKGSSKVFKKRIGVSHKQYITLKANGKVIDKDSI